DQFVGLDPVQFTPLSYSAQEELRGFALYDYLVGVNSKTFEVEPRIAQSITGSSDSKTWTIKIRPDVKFSDGTAYDAEAVKFNWERMGDPANKSPMASAAQTIASMEVTDPLTLVVTLKAVNAQFPRLVATRLGLIGSPTAIKADPTGFGTKPVGAGP